jgi:replicative DNA helicase
MEKLLPYNLDAEEGVTGSLLLGGERNLDLEAGDFYSEQNRWIYEACQELDVVDQITVAQKLDEKNLLEKVGGCAYLSHLISIVPTSLDIEHYAGIVKKLSVKRQLIGVADKIKEQAQDGGDITELLSKADNMLLDLRRKASVNDIVSPEDRAKIAGERYTMLYEAEGGAAIPTGLKDLDRFLGGGLYPELIIVAGRPGMGKTAFLQTITNNMADNDLKVAFISAEMSKESLMDRDIAGAVGVPTQDIRRGAYSEKLYTDIIGRGLEKVQSRQIYTLDSSPITTAKILHFCLTVQARYGLDAVFVDYLGLLDDPCKENQNIRLGQMSRRLKIMSNTLSVPVIVAHQLSRGVEMRENKVPMMSDLRESGHIEEDADTILFLYRESYYKDTNDMTTMIKIAKQRQGEANLIVKTYFDKKSQSYKDLFKEA